MVKDFLLFIRRFMNFISMLVVASRVPVRDAATTSFYAAQKFIPYENTFGQTWKKMGWSVTCFLFWLVRHNAKCQTFRQTAGQTVVDYPYYFFLIRLEVKFVLRYLR